MFDVGVGEILVIAVVGLLVFGPDRLPEMARQGGRWLHDLRAMVASARRDVSGSLDVDPRYLTDPKGSLSRDLLGDDLPTKPGSTRGVSRALGIDEAAEALDIEAIDTVDPDVT